MFLQEINNIRADVDSGSRGRAQREEGERVGAAGGREVLQGGRHAQLVLMRSAHTGSIKQSLWLRFCRVLASFSFLSNCPYLPGADRNSDYQR